MGEVRTSIEVDLLAGKTIHFSYKRSNVVA